MLPVLDDEIRKVISDAKEIKKMAVGNELSTENALEILRIVEMRRQNELTNKLIEAIDEK